MITDDIFMSIQFLDCENHCYGKIEQSEFDENIYAFFPADTNEVDPKLQIEINRMKIGRAHV